MPAIPAIMGSRQEREDLVDTIRRDVSAERADVEIHAVSEEGHRGVRRHRKKNARDHAKRKIGYVVVGPSAIRPSSRVRSRHARSIVSQYCERSEEHTSELQ